MSAAVIHRYGFDDVRRLAAGLGAAAGLSPARSLAMADHLLWFDAAGAPILGIATLPSWLETMTGGVVDPKATGRVSSERTSVAVLDGENGPAPLILGRAAELAVEKARETAAGLVRVTGIGTIPSAAPVAAGIAIGPMAGSVLGPNSCWSQALPSQGGLPLVVDSGLWIATGGGNNGSAVAGGRRGSPSSKSAMAAGNGLHPASSLLEGFRRACEVLVPEGGWLVAAVSVPALEAFSAFDERLASVVAGMAAAPGRLLPEAWEAGRREVRRAGLAVEPSAWKAIAEWARRLTVALPEPLAD